MKNIINIIEIMSDLDELRKKVYLDSPEVFVDLVDKIENNQFDEMVLFFATKYDYLSIVKFIVGNKIINLNKPSQNTKFQTIKDHILAVAVQFNARDIYEYLLNYNETETKEDNAVEDELESFIKNISDTLSGLCGQVNTEDEVEEESENTCEENVENSEPKSEDKITTEQEASEQVNNENLNTDKDCDLAPNYEPKFICPNCNTNIFETGYSTIEKVNYKYSKEEKGVKAISKEQENNVTCSKCGYTIEQLNPAFLENICTVQNCKKCGKDLTSVGIVTKVKTEYDSESNTFITSKKSFHCSECDNELTDYQVNYFKL